MTDKIGIMDGAYFVGRKELLQWLNTLLQINYKKVEQISNGAAMCQVMDTMYPNKNALSKVNFNATMDFEILNNFKILQSEFKRVGIEKVVDIERLKQGRFQDNLEFFQWMKRYYDINPHSDATTYRARERRMEAGCPEPKEIYGGLPHNSSAVSASTRMRSHSSSGSIATTTSTTTTVLSNSNSSSNLNANVSKRQKYSPNINNTVSSTQSVRNTSNTRNMTTLSPSLSSSRSTSTTTTTKVIGKTIQLHSSSNNNNNNNQQKVIHSQSPTLTNSSSTSSVSSRSRSASTGLRAKHASNDPGDIKAVVSVRELTSLQETISSLEKERDFYYERLLKVESLCKSVKENGSELQQKYPGSNKKLMNAILKILYDDGTNTNIEIDDDDDDNSFVEDTVTMNIDSSPNGTNMVVSQSNSNVLSNPITPQQNNNNTLFSTPSSSSSAAPTLEKSTTTSTTTVTVSPSSVTFNAVNNYGMGSIGEVNLSVIGDDSISVDNDVNMN